MYLVVQIARYVAILAKNEISLSCLKIQILSGVHFDFSVNSRAGLPDGILLNRCRPVEYLPLADHVEKKSERESVKLLSDHAAWDFFFNIIGESALSFENLTVGVLQTWIACTRRLLTSHLKDTAVGM